MSSSFPCLWVGWWSCHVAALLLLWYYLSFTLLLPLGLQAKALGSPFSTFFLLWASVASILAEPAHSISWASSTHFIPRASSAHFLLPYLFHSHGFLLNPLGFFGPITTSSPLITFRAYWPLCQPYEFINLFLGLPRLIYFFSTSYYSHGFTTFIPWASLAHLLLPGHLLFLWVCWSLFLPFWPVGFYFTIFPHLLHIVGLLLPLGLFVKSGHQHIYIYIYIRFSDPNYSLNRKRERFKIFEVELRSDRDDVIIKLIIN